MGRPNHMGGWDDDATVSNLGGRSALARWLLLSTAGGSPAATRWAYDRAVKDEPEIEDEATIEALLIALAE